MSVVKVKKIAAGSYIPCNIRMSIRKMKKTKQKVSCACPNWACLTIEGTPYCAAHAPEEARKLYP